MHQYKWVWANCPRCKGRHQTLVEASTRTIGPHKKPIRLSRICDGCFLATKHPLARDSYLRWMESVAPPKPKE